MPSSPVPCGNAIARRIASAVWRIMCISRCGSRTLSVADLVKEVKTASSKWVKTQDASLHDFAWQQGYGVFSVGMSQKETLLHYIETQEEHHRTRTFQDEYRDFLQKYGIAYDERYGRPQNQMMDFDASE